MGSGERRPARPGPRSSRLCASSGGLSTRPSPFLGLSADVSALTTGSCECVCGPQPQPSLRAVPPAAPLARAMSFHLQPSSAANASTAAAAATATSDAAPLSSSSSGSGPASSPAPPLEAAAPPSFDFSSCNFAAFNFGSSVDSSSASASAWPTQPRSDEKSDEAAPPVAASSDPFSAMNRSAFGHSSFSSFSMGTSSSPFSSSSPPLPSGFGFSSGGFAALSSIPTQIQSAPALDPARSAFQALSFDVAPARPHLLPDLSDAERAPLLSPADFQADWAAACARLRSEVLQPQVPVSASDSRWSGTPAIVPAGTFGAPTIVPAGLFAGPTQQPSRSEQPLPDGRTPVLPADAFFSIARFLTLADVNTVLRSSRGGFAAQLLSIPCIGLSHSGGGREAMPSEGRSLMLTRHISMLSVTTWGRPSWLRRVAVQLPSLRSLKLFHLPPTELRWEVPLPRLTSLELGSPHVGSCHVSDLAEHLPSLRALVLSSAVLQSIDLAPFHGLRSLSLPFSDELIGSRIDAIRSLEGLRVLTFTVGGLSSTECAEKTLQSLTRRPHSMQLEEIRCESQPWTDAMIEAAGLMPSLTSLRPSRVGCTRLTALRQLPLLSSLHLHFASFIARIAPADVVSGLQPCSSLTQLTLGGDCMLGREHLTPILLSLTALRELEVPLVHDLECFADAQATLSRSLVKLTLRATRGVSIQRTISDRLTPDRSAERCHVQSMKTAASRASFD